ncbi:hypothetical protein EJ08DRAFT_589898, partial [Tothia fuscella]
HRPLGRFHPVPVGTPEMIADVFEQWIDEADIDGFNIAYVTSPGTFEDVVYLLRLELVKRGLKWEDYDFPGGTLRENPYSVERQQYLWNVIMGTCSDTIVDLRAIRSKHSMPRNRRTMTVALERRTSRPRQMDPLLRMGTKSIQMWKKRPMRHPRKCLLLPTITTLDSYKLGNYVAENGN